MKKLTLLFILTLLLAQLNADAQRGTIVQTIPLLSLTPELIMQNLQLQMDATSFALINQFTYKKNDVNAVKVIYNTIDGNGNPTIASGVVFLPVVQSETQRPVFSYLHGTLTSDFEAPSNLIGSEAVVGWIMSMDGYISVLPDYLGIGDGPGFHPYSHAESEASAGIDLLKATLLLCSDPQVLAKPNGELYLSGYSQGGHAALATQRELEKNPLPNLALQKTVAGSGAYSLSFIQKKFMFDNPAYPGRSFMPYILLGYQSVYGNLYSSLDQVFVPPYNTLIPGYFDGTKPAGVIDALLPSNWKSMFVPKYLWNIQYRYFHPVNIALRKNDLISWKPKTDLHMYYCNCDELVAKENSMLAYLSFLLRGSRHVTLLSLGDFTHRECAPLVLLVGKIQFDCASGINPCGFNLPLLASLTKSATTDLSMLEAALSEHATLDVNELYLNKEINAYLEENPVNGTEWGLYPNPASDVVNIQVFNALPASSRIRIYDMQGRLVQDKIYSEDVVEMNVKAIKAGVYKIVLNDDFKGSKSLIIAR